MAQKVNIVLVDDLDGSEATETVTFGLDGTTGTTLHVKRRRAVWGGLTRPPVVAPTPTPSAPDHGIGPGSRICRPGSRLHCRRARAATRRR